MEEDKMKKQRVLINKKNNRLQKIIYRVEDSEDIMMIARITNTVYNKKVWTKTKRKSIKEKKGTKRPKTTKKVKLNKRS